MEKGSVDKQTFWWPIPSKQIFWQLIGSTGRAAKAATSTAGTMRLVQQSKQDNLAGTTKVATKQDCVGGRFEEHKLCAVSDCSHVTVALPMLGRWSIRYVGDEGDTYYDYGPMTNDKQTDSAAEYDQLKVYCVLLE